MSINIEKLITPEETQAMVERLWAEQEAKFKETLESTIRSTLSTYA